jgi:hypothetical protein
MQGKRVRGWIAAAIVLASGGVVSDAFAQVAPAPHKYSMKIVPTFPKGSAAEKLATTQPSNTKFTPCVEDKLDAVTFTLTYDAGNPAKPETMRDVYVLIFTPNAGTALDVKQYQVGVRQPLDSGWLAFQPIDSINDLTAAKDTMIYLPKAYNPSGKVTENLVMANLSLDGVPKGTWQIVGIIADSSSPQLDFGDSGTWDAWDVATVVVGQPWLTEVPEKDTCY